MGSGSSKKGQDGGADVDTSRSSALSMIYARRPLMKRNKDALEPLDPEWLAYLPRLEHDFIGVFFRNDDDDSSFLVILEFAPGGKKWTIITEELDQYIGKHGRQSRLCSEVRQIFDDYDPGKYHLFFNNCQAYAREMWKRLGGDPFDSFNFPIMINFPFVLAPAVINAVASELERSRGVRKPSLRGWIIVYYQTARTHVHSLYIARKSFYP
ncbi:hypothetical protein M3Y99_00949500 [Aphelenchoides fujianensis]|nr:hypothetical protein M3Y99_00949500 [Aphelenchoides fujianensis]